MGAVSSSEPCGWRWEGFPQDSEPPPFLSIVSPFLAGCESWRSLITDGEPLLGVEPAHQISPELNAKSSSPHRA